MSIDTRYMMKTELIKLKNEMTISAAQDSQYVLNLAEGRKAKITLFFEKEGVSAEIIGLFTAGKDTDVDLETVVIHRVPNTSCMTYVKGVLFEGGKSNYVGRIIIEKAAQKTNSFLTTNVLVVGGDTHNSSQPILMIEADDVKASHAATTGRIDPNEVYYLQSRGFSKDEAEGVIVDGFFESLLSKITDDEIKKEMHESFRRKDN